MGSQGEGMDMYFVRISFEWATHSSGSEWVAGSVMACDAEQLGARAELTHESSWPPTSTPLLTSRIMDRDMIDLLELFSSGMPEAPSPEEYGRMLGLETGREGGPADWSIDAQMGVRDLAKVRPLPCYRSSVPGVDADLGLTFHSSPRRR